MKPLVYILTLLAFFACNERTVQEENNTINVKDAMHSVRPIELSEITSGITYIPLETTDSSLIGEQADMRVFNTYILVSSANQNLKLFDRKSGKFLSEIGHIGIDPQGYAKDSWGKVNYWVDSRMNHIYVLGWKNDWQVYDVHNNYIKRIAIEDNVHYNLAQSCFLIDGDWIYGQNKFGVSDTIPSLFVYQASDSSIRTIPGLQHGNLPFEDFLSVSLLLGNYVGFGGDLYMETYSGDRKLYTAVNSPSLWKSGQEIRVKQVFNDTIYTVRQNQLHPYRIFDLGDWHWEYAERLQVAGCENRIAIDYVLENEDILYFHFHTGLYSDNSKTYCGIYKKENGEVKIMEGDEWIDSEHNQVLQIRNISNEGNFCALLLPEKLSDELKEQLQVGEEDNPVIALF